MSASRQASALNAHVGELPLVRRGIFEAVYAFSRQLPPGTRLLDAGAGNAPYADLFAHCEYVTADWGHSIHEGARHADIIASLDDLPVPDGDFHAVLCTEVLEHVANPEVVVSELHRVLAASGRLCLTVPFVWPLHEEPYDYFRYTPHALHGLLENAGFVDVSIAATSGFFTTLAQVAEMALWQRRRPNRRLDALRQQIALQFCRHWIWPLRWMATRNQLMDSIFTGVPLPLGFHASARKVG